MQYARNLTLLLLFALALIKLQAQNTAAANYDESKVPAYTLPDVLKTTTGQKVSNKTTWEKVRRPEIINLFEDHIYGQMPKSVDRLTYSIKSENTSAMSGKATLKEVLIEVAHNQKRLTINLVLFVPTKRTGPVPVFLLINNRGKDNTDPTRAHTSDFWPAEMVIDSGYAVAAFHVSDLAPDDTLKYINGVLQLYPEQLTAPNGMRAIGAWAWGASRVLDYFEKESAIDAKKVAVVGHSRGGKASLWAAAEDQRFAMCFTNCSGNTGAALSRRRFGETVSRINTVFPHWFAKNYKKFNNNEDALPVDQHMLLAAIAPRPLYATNATKDLWADPVGTFLSLKQAEPVYALYGITSKLPVTPPAVNQPVINSPLGYHIREGEHNLTAYDWSNFIKFANIHFKK
ncbi:acetylxylan esterase [Spirosoma harenae]